MFLKSAGFKKLIKEAYTGQGLKVGNDGEGIYLSGGYWIIWVRGGCIPKKELASIIELTGEIPDPGTGFEATKAGNQYEMQNNPLYRVMDNAGLCDEELRVTQVLLQSIQGIASRVLQDEKNRIYLVNERFIDMVSNNEVEYQEGETAAVGPLIGPHAGVFWRNNIMAMHVMCRNDGRSHSLVEKLEKMTIQEDKE